MAQLTLKSIKNAVNHWYIPFAVGVVFIALAIYSIVTPEQSFLALTYLFSISFILTGLAEITFSYANKNEIPFAVFYGEEEREKKYLTLKDMKSGKQENLTLEKLIEKLKK